MLTLKKALLVGSSIIYMGCGGLSGKDKSRKEPQGANSSAENPDEEPGPTGKVMLGGSNVLLGLHEPDQQGYTLEDTPGMAINESLTLTTARLSVAMISLQKSRSLNPIDLFTLRKANKEEREIEEKSFQLTTDEFELKKSGPKVSAEKRAAGQKGFLDIFLWWLLRNKTIRFKGPFMFDAISGQLETGSSSTELKEGTYQRISFKLKNNFEVPPGDPLEGNAVVIEGIYKRRNGTNVGVLVEYDRTLNVSIGSRRGFAVRPGVENILGIFFHVKKWFDGVNLEDASIDPSEEKIIISRKNNRALLKKIANNIRTTAGFYQAEGAAAPSSSAVRGPAFTAEDNEDSKAQGDEGAFEDEIDDK